MQLDSRKRLSCPAFPLFQLIIFLLLGLISWDGSATLIRVLYQHIHTFGRKRVPFHVSFVIIGRVWGVRYRALNT